MRMEGTNICRCCLAEGLHKDLNETYVHSNKIEIYSNMLLECFNIVVLPLQANSNTICSSCINLLRSSLDFKQQVLNSERALMRRTNAEPIIESNIEVKMEPPQDDTDFSDSDDYFLADTVSDPKTKVKTEHVEPEVKAIKTNKILLKNRSRIIKKSSEEWKTNKIKTLVTRLTASMGSCDKQPIKKPVPRKLTLSKDLSPQITFTWTKNDKSKHRENVATILNYSNALPFKNKTLLGFICAYCDSCFPDPNDLRDHTEKEHKKDKLKLSTRYITEYCFKIDITDLTCTICDDKIDNLADLKTHLSKKHGKVIYTDIKDYIMQFKLKKGEVYDCALCSSTYETFKMLKQHMNIHYNNYSCTECDSVFATKRSLSAHKSTHLEGSYKCDYCEKVFSTQTKKHYHVKMKHLGARNISNCPHCDEPFRSYYQRNQHLIKVHNNESRYKCNVCNKEFILKSLLMYHIKKSHLMERNAQCNECGYRFFSKKALKAHMVKHTGERNYSCEVCHKSYARKYTLREHMRIHNNDRRFKCDVCGITFVQKCSLKSHLLSNHGISMTASEISCNIESA